MKVKAKLWTKPRHRLSFFMLYLLPALRIDGIRFTQQEKSDYGLNYNAGYYIIIGWLFWIFEININI